jgi:GR25 family glycosyltransferase involved in LPS biosynthesis
MTDQNPHAYHGLYINLDRSPERRRNIESQLAEFGLLDRYARFPAVDGSTVNHGGSPLKPGEIGVFLSHHHALEQARTRGQYVHILEDDALLTRHLPVVIEDAIRMNLFERYDLLFTDSVVNCHLGLMKNLTAGFDQTNIPETGSLRLSDLKVMDLAQIFFASFQSYVVGARSIARVLALYDQEIANGIKTPIDIFVQQQVLGGKLRAACVFPFLTIGRIEDITASTIAGRGDRMDKPSAIVMAVLHYLFFVGRDLDYAKRILDGITKGPRKPTALHHDLVMDVTEFVMSPDFEEF